MKRMKTLLRNPPDRSARFVPSQPVFPTITNLRPPLSALLPPNRRSQLQGLREPSPHHLRSRPPSPSKRVMRSKHLDHMPSTHHFCCRLILFMICQVHITVSRHLSTSQTNIGDYIVLSQLHYISYKQIFPLRGNKQSVQSRYHLYASLHALFPSFSMTSCEKLLERMIGCRATIARTP